MPNASGGAVLLDTLTLAGIHTSACFHRDTTYCDPDEGHDKEEQVMHDVIFSTVSGEPPVLMGC